MHYLLRLTDSASRRTLVLTLDERMAKHPAIDIVFELLGAENPDDIADMGVIADGLQDDLMEFQQIIFDRDAQGLFIKEGISFKAYGKELDPDQSLIQSFTAAERDGMKYMRLDLVLENDSPHGIQSKELVPEVAAVAAPAASLEEQVKEFARIFFLHQLAIGFAVDVTREYPELIDVIKFAESKGWIEIDVKKVQYKLTAEGKSVYDRYMDEAQDLIRRFDIYSDVDVDSSGKVRFDTGLGSDLRVPAFEMEGVDPFRARFLLGLNDGEWDKLDNWFESFESPSWYAEIFEPIETAPSIDEIGRPRLTEIIDQAKAALRQGR